MSVFEITKTARKHVGRERPCRTAESKFGCAKPAAIRLEKTVASLQVWAKMDNALLDFPCAISGTVAQEDLFLPLVPHTGATGFADPCANLPKTQNAGDVMLRPFPASVCFTVAHSSPESF